MGLQSQLNDVSSESIPILLVALIANCVSYVRSVLLGLLPHRFGPEPVVVVDEGLLGPVGSGLTGLIVLADQLNRNRAFSYPYSTSSSDGGVGSSDCVVCMSTLSPGDQVRRLSCHHVFHKDCFDGWLGHLNFNCPLCRSPLVSAAASADQSVALTRRSVGSDLVGWFSLR